jgi:hypothetical protein
MVIEDSSYSCFDQEAVVILGLIKLIGCLFICVKEVVCVNFVLPPGVVKRSTTFSSSSPPVISQTQCSFFSLPNLHIQRLQRCGFKLSLLLLMLILQDIASFIRRMCNAQCRGSSKLIIANVTKKGREGEMEIKMVHYYSLHSYLEPHRCLNKNAIYAQCIRLTSAFKLLSCN